MSIRTLSTVQIRLRPSGTCRISANCLPCAVSSQLSLAAASAAVVVVVSAATATAFVLIGIVTKHRDEDDQNEDPAAAVVTEIKTTHNNGLLKIISDETLRSPVELSVSQYILCGS